FQIQRFDFSSPKINIPCDLGQGVYFYTDFNGETGKKNALKYTHQFKDKIREKEHRSHVVIKARLKCFDENLLDLDNPENVEIFLTFRNKLDKELKKYINRLKNTGAARRKNYDGIVIELFIRKVSQQYKDKENQNIKIIKKKTNTEFDHIRSNFSNGTELCVRDISCICLLNKEVI